MSNSVTRINDLAHIPAKVMYVLDANDNTFRPVNSSDLGGVGSNYQDFAVGLGTGLNSTVTIDNTDGFSSIGLHLLVPDNGTIRFDGSFDGINFTPVQLRELSSNGYTQSTDHDEDFLGSISTLRKIRFTTTVGGTATGTAAGRLGREAATLEGAENSAPPHRFGNELFHKGFSGNGTLTNLSLYTPPSGSRFAITYLSFSITSTAGTNVTFHEGSSSSDDTSKWMFSAFIDTPAGDADIVNQTFSTPFVSSSTNSGLYLTTSALATVRGVFHGYNTTV